MSHLIGENLTFIISEGMFKKRFFPTLLLPCKSGFAEIFVVSHEAFYISLEVNQSRDSSRTNLQKVFPDGKFINWDMEVRKQILHEIKPHRARKARQMGN